MIRKILQFVKPVFQFALILLVGLGIILLGTFLVNSIKKPLIIEKPVEKTVILRPPECPRSYEAYQTLVDGGQSVQLLKNANSYATQGKFVKTYRVLLNRTGEIGCGYFYVRAKKATGALDEKYESVYVNPQGLGGHLLRPRSIPLANYIPNTTEILLPLDAIPYLPSIPYDPNSQDYRLANWTKLLNASHKIEFIIGLSVQDTTAIIEEVRIAYKCWDSETGKETQNCQLSK